MKIIFLDHDGVICLPEQWGGRRSKLAKWNKLNPDNKVFYEYDDHKMDVEYRFDNFDSKAVKVLNRILKETDAEIVVSSDWRHSCSLEEMKDLYKKYGVIKSPIDYTIPLDDIDFKSFRIPIGYEEERSLEIKKWLKSNEVESWVAVDDLDMSLYLKNFVQTKKRNEGIKQLGIASKIITILNK